MNHYPQKPFSACYWLKPGQLLAGELPSDIVYSEAIEKLKTLLNVGIKVVINLLSDEDLETYSQNRSYHRSEVKGQKLSLFPDYRPGLIDLMGRSETQVECIHFPIKDMGTPTISQMKRILDLIDLSMSEGKAVYFHCYAGLGRTGTVAGCWLARHRSDTQEDVLQTLHQVRADQGLGNYGRSPETEAQRDFVYQWKYGQ